MLIILSYSSCGEMLNIYLLMYALCGLFCCINRGAGFVGKEAV